MSVFSLLEYKKCTLKRKKRVRNFSTVIYIVRIFMSVDSLPRPYLPDSTLYAFQHDCDDYGPLTAFIQLTKGRDDITLK